MLKNQLCYGLIENYNELEKFIKILPDEKDGEQFYITLFSRKKYDTSGLLRCDKNCLKRVTARKKDIISKIEQMEARYGCYTYDDKPIPDECLAVYITPNPRSFRSASIGLAKALVTKLCDGVSVGNPQSEALNYLQVCSENKVYFDIDVDFLKPENLAEFKSKISEFINLDCLTFVRTRGGYHCLVKVGSIREEYSKKWHQGFTKLRFGEVQIMMNSDGLIPVPGTTAGLDKYIILED
jgi:hypothetical protein